MSPLGFSWIAMDLVMDLDSAAPFYEMRLARDGYAYKERQNTATHGGTHATSTTGALG